MGKQEGASTKRKATKIKTRLKRQGYKGAIIVKNPASLVGKHRIKKYTVIAGRKTTRKKRRRRKR